jgi:hypothetical protein
MSLFDSVFGAGAQQALMGSEQEMYDMRAQQYNAALAQSMMSTKQAVAQGVMASAQVIKSFNPNEIEAYKIPLSQLVTLWQAKYGDTWVDKPDEDFWSVALTRLNVAGKLEHAGGWYRITEDA